MDRNLNSNDYEISFNLTPDEDEIKKDLINENNNPHFNMKIKSSGVKKEGDKKFKNGSTKFQNNIYVQNTNSDSGENSKLQLEAKDLIEKTRRMMENLDVHRYNETEIKKNLISVHDKHSFSIKNVPYPNEDRSDKHNYTDPSSSNKNKILNSKQFYNSNDPIKNTQNILPNENDYTFTEEKPKDLNKIIKIENSTNNFQNFQSINSLHTFNSNSSSIPHKDFNNNYDNNTNNILNQKLLEKIKQIKILEKELKEKNTTIDKLNSKLGKQNEEIKKLNDKLNVNFIFLK
jgi:hypothetical protein